LSNKFDGLGVPGIGRPPVASTDSPSDDGRRELPSGPYRFVDVTRSARLTGGSLMAENPVIAKFGKASGAIGPVGTPDSADLQRMYDEPSYTGPRTTVRYMTLDDVVQRTGAMLAVL